MFCNCAVDEFITVLDKYINNQSAELCTSEELEAMGKPCNKKGGEKQFHSVPDITNHTWREAQKLKDSMRFKSSICFPCPVTGVEVKLVWLAGCWSV